MAGRPPSFDYEGDGGPMATHLHRRPRNALKLRSFFAGGVLSKTLEADRESRSARTFFRSRRHAGGTASGNPAEDHLTCWSRGAVISWIWTSEKTARRRLDSRCRKARWRLECVARHYPQRNRDGTFVLETSTPAEDQWRKECLRWLSRIPPPRGSCDAALSSLGKKSPVPGFRGWPIAGTAPP